MNIIRETLLSGQLRMLVPILALIFVVSVSFHNHAIGLDSSTVIEVTDTHHDTLHSVEDCSACLLQGNLKLPDTEYAYSSPVPVVVSSLTEIELLLPESYLKLNKPSRSPPRA